MVEKKIKLNLVTDVKTFVNAASRYPFDIDLVSGRYVIDAKSVMGIYTLDLSKTLDLRIHADETEAATFLEKIKNLLV